MLKSVVLGVALVVAGFAGSAQAAIVDVSYAGLISSGSDVTGAFGTAGADLSGDAVAVTYVFNTGLGIPSSSSTDKSVIGGTLFSAASPALSATITILNTGKSVTFDGDSYGAIAEQSNPFYSFQSHYATSTGGSYVYSSITAASGALSASLTNAFAYAPLPTNTAVGYFQLAGWTFGASFSPTLLSETVVSSVPLPAGFPMFGVALLGLGAFGLTKKRKGQAGRAQSAG